MLLELLLIALIPKLIRGSHEPNKAASILRNASIYDIFEDLNATIIFCDNCTKTKLPKYLCGSLYRVGPAYFLPELNKNTKPKYPEFSHGFNGLGMVHAFHFNKDGSVSYYGKFQRTGEYERVILGETDLELEDGTLLSPNSQVTIRRIASDGKLLSNDGRPWSNSFNPITVEIEDRPYIYGDDRMFDPLLSVQVPSHAQTDLDGSIFHYIFVFDFSGENNGYYQLYHIGPDSNKRIFADNKIYPNPIIGQPMWQHSQGLTENYMIICEVPFITPDFVWLGDNIQFVSWYIVNKFTGELVATFYSPSFMYFHFANSYEVIDEITGEITIITDIVTFPNADGYDALYVEIMIDEWEQFMDAACEAQLKRFILPLNSQSIFNDTNTWILPVALSDQIGVEFPLYSYDLYNTKPYEYVYLVGTSNCDKTDDDRSNLWDLLIKQQLSIYPSTQIFDSLIWSKPGHYPSEPVFVHDPNGNDEDDGILLSVTYNSNSDKSYLLILNAKTMKEIASIIPNSPVIPFTFHGRYYNTPKTEKSSSSSSSSPSS